MDKKLLEQEMTKIFSQTLRSFLEKGSFRVKSTGYELEITLSGLKEYRATDFQDEKLRLYYALKYTTPEMSYSNRSTDFYYVSLPETVQVEFLKYWYHQLQKKEHRIEFLVMCPKVATLRNCVEFLKHDVELLKQFLSLPTRNYIATPSNRDFLFLMDTSFDLLKEEEMSVCLRAYVDNHKVFFKRVEALSILNDYVKRFSLENQVCFEQTLREINATDYMVEPFETWGLVLNKRTLFSTIYNERMTDKYQITEFLTALVSSFNDPKAGKELSTRLKLSHVYLQNDNGSCPYYTLVLCGESQNLHDYKAIFKSFIESGIHAWLDNRFTLPAALVIIMNQYFLNQKLQQETKPVAGRKFKI